MSWINTVIMLLTGLPTPPANQLKKTSLRRHPFAELLYDLHGRHTTLTRLSDCSHYHYKANLSAQRALVLLASQSVGLLHVFKPCQTLLLNLVGKRATVHFSPRAVTIHWSLQESMSTVMDSKRVGPPTRVNRAPGF